MKNTLKNIKIKELSAAALKYEPVNIDEGFTSIGGHEFYSREACTCDKCGAVFTDTCGDTQHFNVEDTECDGWLGAVEGVMMAYCYPLPSSPTDEEVKSLKDLPLCVLDVGDENKSYLALTGGGMDLSWEICEGYIRLGWLPPAYFCNLRSPGCALDANERVIVRACLESFSRLEKQYNFEKKSLKALAKRMGTK